MQTTCRRAHGAVYWVMIPRVACGVGRVRLCTSVPGSPQAPALRPTRKIGVGARRLPARVTACRACRTPARAPRQRSRAGNPPRPSSHRLPPMVSRCVQLSLRPWATDDEVERSPVGVPPRPLERLDHPRINRPIDSIPFSPIQHRNGLPVFCHAEGRIGANGPGTAAARESEITPVLMEQIGTRSG